MFTALDAAPNKLIAKGVEPPANLISFELRSVSLISVFISCIDISPLLGNWLKTNVSKDEPLQMFVYRREIMKRFRPDQILEKNRDANDSQSLKFCKASKKLKVGIIVQTGSWDLSFLGLNTSLVTVMPVLNKSMHVLSKIQQNTENMKILVMGPPPLNPARLKIGRSNADAMLYNQALHRLSLEHGIKYFNIFDVIQPVYEHNLGTHYINCNHIWKEKCRGNAGISGFQAAVASLIEQFD